MSSRSLIVIIIASLFGLACGDDSSAVPDGGPRDGGTAADGGMAADGPRTDSPPSTDAGQMVRIRGVVVSPFGGTISGATVSDARHAEVVSATSDVDGVFSLFVPVGEPLLVVAHLDGLLDTLIPAAPLDADLDMANIPLFSREDLDASRAPLPPSTPGTGTLVLAAVSPASMSGMGGVRFATVDTDPLVFSYLSSAMPPAPDPTLTATTANGQGATETAPLGAETAIPVRATAIAGHPCRAVAGWEHASMSDVLAAPVRPDAITLAQFDCAPPAGERMVWGKLTEYTPGVPVSSGAAIGGASICLFGSSTCVTSEPDGLYAIDVPAAADFALTYDAAGREPILTPLRAGTDPIQRSVGLPAAGYFASTATAYGVTQAATQGAIEFFTTGPGVTVTMPIGTADGPHYLGPMVAVDPSLTETSSQGWGLFFAAEPADFVEMTFDHSDATRPCTAIGDTAWETTTPESIRVPVVAGYTTFAALRCPVP